MLGFTVSGVGARWFRVQGLQCSFIGFKDWVLEFSILYSAPKSEPKSAPKAETGYPRNSQELVGGNI